jgi:predicted ATPase
LDAEGLRQRGFLAIRNWIEAVSRQNPVVLMFSDLQWADDSSLDLLRYCLPICDSEPVMFLLSFRSEPENSIADFHHYLNTEYPHRLKNINLPPLTEEQSHQLIDHLIGAEILPRETSDLILRNSGGNPYYILELIRSLIDNGVLVAGNTGDGWHLTRRVTTLDLPDSLHRLLLARMDRLSAQQKLVLQVSSVIGSVFWINLVQFLLDDPQSLQKDINILQRNQFIQENGRVPELGMEYLFKSPLIRETAYDSLLNTQKSAYHLKVAEYIESEISPAVLDDYEGILAYHYRCAGNINKELFYTFLAAEKARRIYANTEALKLYTRAIELLDQLENDRTMDYSHSILTQRFEALNGRRKVLMSLGQVESARADTRALLPLARQMTDDPAWLIDAMLAQAELAFDNRAELWSILEMAREALGLSRQIDDRRRELQSLMVAASSSYYLKEHQAAELAEQALALARQLGDLRTEVEILLGLSGIYGMDNLGMSREYLEEALARSKALNDKAIEMRLLEALSQQYEREGNYCQLLADYEQKQLQLSREIGNRLLEAKVLMFCGQIRALYLGDFEAGLEMEKRSSQMRTDLNDRLFPMLRIAQIQTAQGKYTEAMDTLNAAFPLSERVLYDYGRAGLRLVTIILYGALGDYDHLRAALDITWQIRKMAADNLISRQYQMAAACEASAIHLQLAAKLKIDDPNGPEHPMHTAQALESSQSALDIYQQFGFVQVVECTSEEVLFRHSQALAANGRSEEANEFLQRAYREMMRKHDLIPADSPFRKSFLTNIQLHVDIQNLYREKLPPKPRRRKSSPPSSQ